MGLLDSLVRPFTSPARLEERRRMSDIADELNRPIHWCHWTGSMCWLGIRVGVADYRFYVAQEEGITVFIVPTRLKLISVPGAIRQELFERNEKLDHFEWVVNQNEPFIYLKAVTSVPLCAELVMTAISDMVPEVGAFDVVTEAFKDQL